MGANVGVTVKHKPGRRLVGDRTAKSRLLPTRVTETLFADDAAVFSTTQQDFETSPRLCVSVCILVWYISFAFV